ncbi:MAG: DNA repair protein RadA [Ruminiclostridium sp.]|nr:DNA repair protein RadA [Ruminiclostridium sp.]
MAKAKTVYSCSECGQQYPKWAGRCNACGAWNSLTEEVVVKQTASASKGASLKLTGINSVSFKDETRYNTGMGELDRVLGGGLVKGSLVLLSGDPGIGKSTLLLQICTSLAKDKKVLYISGEESERQIKLRADRLGVSAEGLYISASTDCNAIIEGVREEKPDVVIIDSIQTMQMTEIQSVPGSLVQVRECTSAFMQMAKSLDISVFLVGHVNKDGGIAGPKVLEHIVDTVLYFEGDKQLSYRILRAVKNRFGSTNEIGVFEMRDKGLFEVENPSAMLLSGRPAGVSGITVLCTMEGSRPILAEVQALVSKTGFSAPRRVSAGFDYNRLCVLLAVLEKRAGLLFGAYDVYINIIGGLKIDEPASDLAIALALYSGLLDKDIGDDVAVFGELGLGGEIRAVSHIRQRVREAARMGFEKCIVPKSSLKDLDKAENYGISIYGAANIKQAFSVIEAISKNNETKE